MGARSAPLPDLFFQLSGYPALHKGVLSFPELSDPFLTKQGD
ncbi:hypothetical protein TDIS_0560 [Thermosulfurimonas dismutans]|uniref:Uncharacterized protein n=1 Tax=Thermosulfurimonas dismutans TaxID=999894 RepID=A0A179D5G3_9BACT|nr:hypothetical protein TDIS_0560 [Thermosulfurimonas dismutans]